MCYNHAGKLYTLVHDKLVACERGLLNNFVSNGLIREAPLRALG